MKKLNKKGFTLVELVIVIAVIAILAAVLIPVFSNVISKANDSKALQNARNTYEAYVADHATEVGSINIVIKGADDRYFTVKAGTFDADNIYPTEAAAKTEVGTPGAGEEWKTTTQYTCDIYYIGEQ